MTLGHYTSPSSDRSVNPRSALFVTLDSCRYDTFVNADVPNLRSLGPVHRAKAPSHFTYGSHSAMFVGFTPGVAEEREPYVNPKFGKIFKLGSAAFPGYSAARFDLEGATIIDGFARKGYRTIGSGAVTWFDPETAPGRALTQHFSRFFYPGTYWALERQISWLDEQLGVPSDEPVFVFLNIGETHVPYYYEGAPWSPETNPCVPFSGDNDADECAARQRMCLEFVDRMLKPLLDRFAEANTVVCGDHGDCWGEDGLWEHGVHHEATLTVPLVMRLNDAR